MTDKDFNRYKGQFIKGTQPKIKRPNKNNIVFCDGKLEVNLATFSHNGKIPAKRGAL